MCWNSLCLWTTKNKISSRLKRVQGRHFSFFHSTFAGGWRKGFLAFMFSYLAVNNEVIVVRKKNTFRSTGKTKRGAIKKRQAHHEKTVYRDFDPND